MPRTKRISAIPMSSPGRTRTAGTDVLVGRDWVPVFSEDRAGAFAAGPQDYLF